jgi:hypothetical protein
LLHRCSPFDFEETDLVNLFTEFKDGVSYSSRTISVSGEAPFKHFKEKPPVNAFYVSSKTYMIAINKRDPTNDNYCQGAYISVKKVWNWEGAGGDCEGKT